MAKTFDELCAAGVALAPVATEIDGLDEELLLHQFTSADFDALVEKHKFTSGKPESVWKAAICFLKGKGYEPKAADRDQLQAMFTNAQIERIAIAGLRLNGFGSGTRAAVKN